MLSPSGVAFVSYNALPGYRHRQTLRELLALELEGIDEPRLRIAGARRLLARLSGDNEPATAIGAEAAELAARSDALLFHDALADVNDAFSFTDFAARAAGHGLRYLAEADLRDLRTDTWPPESPRRAARRRRRPAPRAVPRLPQAPPLPPDAAVPRRHAPASAPVAARFASLAVASYARPHVADDERPELVTFEAPGGAQMTTEDERVVAALVRLAQAWPAAVSVAELLGDEPDPAARALCDALLHGAVRGIVWPHAHPPALSVRAGERPHASALARLQARDGEPVATLRHNSIRIGDELDRRVLALLDGTRDRAALHARLAGFGGLPADELAERVEAILERIASAALLTA